MFFVPQSKGKSTEHCLLKQPILRLREYPPLRTVGNDVT
jgi:hypothetical protein